MFVLLAILAARQARSMYLVGRRDVVTVTVIISFNFQVRSSLNYGSRQSHLISLTP